MKITTTRKLQWLYLYYEKMGFKAKILLTIKRDIFK